jgi:chromosome segregation ATPase
MTTRQGLAKERQQANAARRILKQRVKELERSLEAALSECNRLAATLTEAERDLVVKQQQVDALESKVTLADTEIKGLVGINSRLITLTQKSQALDVAKTAAATNGATKAHGLEDLI